jgi:hypothetical protein
MSVRLFVLWAGLLAACAVSGLPAAYAGQGADAAMASASAAAPSVSVAASASQSEAPTVPLKPDPANAKLPQYKGTLNGRPVIVRLGPKPDDPGLHGEYQFLDNGAVILLAGDRSDDTLELEESNDGTNITGVWVGTIAANGAISATRMEPDQTGQVPVEIKPVK